MIYLWEVPREEEEERGPSPVQPQQILLEQTILLEIFIFTFLVLSSVAWMTEFIILTSPLKKTEVG